MMSTSECLRQAQHIEVTILVDNYSNLTLSSTPQVRRPSFLRETGFQEPLIAEHGLSQLIRIETHEEDHVVLMDAGASTFAATHNAKVLGVNLSEIEAIVLSHGHTDHVGGLLPLLDELKGPVPIFLHPHALLERRYRVLEDGRKKWTIPLNGDMLSAKGASLVNSTSPHLLAAGLIQTTGEIERFTDFETGVSHSFYEEEGIRYRDQVLDDQALAMVLKNKGLVVVTGCAHAGIVNTVRHAQLMTGVHEVYALIGGFHLARSAYHDRIEPTIDRLETMKPSLIAANHCTGFAAMRRLADRLPESFKVSGVGTTFILE